MKGYIIKKYLSILLVLLSLVMAGCSATEANVNPQETYQNIDVETLETMMKDRRDSFLLVNTHIPFEGNLPDTDFSVPYNETTKHLDLFPDDKNAEIVLYCMNDPMSHIAAAALVDAGYTNVKNLVGGMNAWTKAGLPLEMKP